jgi:hypothetical protein
MTFKIQDSVGGISNVTGTVILPIASIPGENRTIKGLYVTASAQATGVIWFVLNKFSFRVSGTMSGVELFRGALYPQESLVFDEYELGGFYHTGTRLTGQILTGANITLTYQVTWGWDI